MFENVDPDISGRRGKLEDIDKSDKHRASHAKTLRDLGYHVARI